MRLIDADVLISEFRKEMDKSIFEGRSVQEVIDDTPAVDAVPVVRCKDCFLYGECQAAKFYGEDGYCSVGERRDKDDE